MNGMKWAPRGFGGTRTDPEIVKREGWLDMGTLVVQVSDGRLTWPEREVVEQIGEKLYGKFTRRSLPSSEALAKEDGEGGRKTERANHG